MTTFFTLATSLTRADFIPNEAISGARRQRIHKVIEYGAAWVKEWRSDITHIVVDDAREYDYAKVLQHLRRANIPVSDDDFVSSSSRALNLPQKGVTLVPFDPYIPECIQYNQLVNTSPTRFWITGAPQSRPQVPDPLPSPSSQESLQINKSIREQKAQASQETATWPSRAPSPQATSPVPSSDRVEDSFVVAPREPSPVPVNSSPAYNDELSAAIATMKNIAHLPLDDDEKSFDSSRRSSVQEDQGSGNETGEETPKPKKVSKDKKPDTPSRSNGKKSGFNQLAFQCMDPRGTNHSTAGSPNAQTIQVLEDMCKYYDQMGDNWRTLAYRRAIGALRKQTIKICTREQAEALPYIGSSLAEKIEEIVLTNRLRKLDNAKSDPRDEVLRLFMGIYGVGLSQANKWIQAGHRTLDDLVKSPNVKLTSNQKVGIEHYQDFITRIPREEVEKHGEVVRQVLQKIDRGFEVTIMGSYRRGAKDSGDIDLIITKSNTPLSTMRTLVFSTLVPKLFRHGFLKATLATSHFRNSEGKKWHGASCLLDSTVWRRLDLLLVPEEEMGAALIYFTGNDIFNRSMRLLASKKGMRLNQKGLYKDVMRGKGREKLTEGTLVEGRDEKRIFEILGVPWRRPEERIC